MLVNRDEVKLIAHARSGDDVISRVQRHGDQQIVLDLLFVVRHQFPGVGLNFHHHEIRHHLDILVLEDVAQVLRGDGFGESR